MVFNDLDFEFHLNMYKYDSRIIHNPLQNDLLKFQSISISFSLFSTLLIY
jgi:hypothetical protein